MEATNEETFELAEGQIAFEGAAGVGILSKAEQKQYLSDRQYLRNLAPKGKAVGLNHADPRQHRFAVLRLKMAGKTPANSPQLFRMMDELKASQEAKGLAVGTFQISPQVEGDLASQHEILTTGLEQGQIVTSGALASRKDQLSWGYVDSAVWDEYGNPLGDQHYIEVYGNMPYFVPQSTGYLAWASSDFVEGDSFLSETLVASNTLQQSYIAAEPQAAATINGLDLPIIEEPRDRDGNGATVICLDRVWTGDCELNNTGMWTLKVPLKGSITVNGAGNQIDTAVLATYKSANGPFPGRIYVTLGTSGGGCVLPAGGQDMSMKDFWAQVTASPPDNPTKLSWDLYTNPAKWASFSNNCRLVQDTAYITMEIGIPYVNVINTARGIIPVTITNADRLQRPLTPPSLQFHPALRITNSCLAAGTMVALPGSEARKIEELAIGDKVMNPFASSLTITDTAVGTEKSPMVRIADARGRELLMTETHPISVVGRGMVAAKFLKVGDRVKTDDGDSELVRVTRESYSGQVFNLKVGTPDEARDLGVDQTAVFANGFLVGDGQIQDKYERLEMHANDTRTRLPVSWRTDYQSSLTRSESK